MNDTPIIDPKNVPMWTAASFVIALLALILALGSMYRTQASVAFTQAEILGLSKQMKASNQAVAKAPQAQPSAQGAGAEAAAAPASAGK
jgi:hypothetical protein